MSAPQYPTLLEHAHRMTRLLHDHHAHEGRSLQACRRDECAERVEQLWPDGTLEGCACVACSER